MNPQNMQSEPQTTPKRKIHGCVIAILVLLGLGIVGVGGCVLLTGAVVSNIEKEKQAKIKALETATPSELLPDGDLANKFNLISEHTDIQRENTEKEIKGQVVQWTLTVYEVTKNSSGYRIQTKTSIGGYGNEVAAFVELTARNQEEKSFIEELKTEDRFQFKGYIDGITMRSLDIKPAILVNPNSTSSNNANLTAAERKVAQAQAQGERELNQSVEEARAIRKAIGLDKDVAADQPIPHKATPPNTVIVISPEALQTATPSDMSPHDSKSSQDWSSHAGEIVEWRLNVRDVQRVPNAPNTYLLETGNSWEISCKVELASHDERMNKVIEGISPNTSIAIRGQLVGIEDSHLVIRPAILIGEQLSNSILKKIETLTKTSEKSLQLSDLEADIKPNSDRTTIQQETITHRLKTLKGSLVQGTFTNYSAEPTSSGCVLVQYDGQSYKQRDNPICIQIFSPVKSKEAMEQLVPTITSGKPISFRGYIAEIESGKIQIDPAILIHPPTVALAPKEMKPLQTEAGQLSAPASDAPAIATNSATPDVSEARMQLDEDRLALERERLELERQKLETNQQSPTAASGERLNTTVVSMWDLARVRYEINTIYARRGVEFLDKEIQAWADTQSWYQRVPGRNASGAESLFTDSERFNIELLAVQRARASGKEKSDQPSKGAWIFIDSSQRRLTKADLAGLNADQLWRARNEIYARNGLIFSTPRGRAFVGTLGDQYRGTDNSQEGVFGRMNEIEKANVEMIKKLE